MAYQVKNLLLKYPQDWFIEAETIAVIKESLPKLSEFYKNEGKADPIKTNLSDYVKEPLKDVFTVPLLSQKVCEILMKEIEGMGFVPNDEEDELRQMPEFVFAHNSPELYYSFMTVAYNILNPIFLALWNKQIDGGNVQIANYNPRDKSGGAWHHDGNADITVVIPLNTGEYDGGGTAFYNRGEVAPLPTGTALIFPSFTHMHKGLTVTKGNRYLLVFWLTNEKDKNGKL